jgi:hypothetical protein
MTDSTKNINKAKVLEKVRKLLAMANHERSNEQEAATAARQAAYILKKHNLSIVDITPEQAKSDVIRATEDNMKWTAKKCPAWVSGLAVTIANTFDAKVVYAQTNKQDGHVRSPQFNFSFIGFEVDAIVSKDMFKYLYDTIVRLSDDWAKDQVVPKGKMRTFKISYRTGMADRLISRFLEIQREKKEEEAVTTSNCTGLVVVKEKAINDFLGYKVSYGTRKRTLNKNATAYSYGYTKGGAVSLNKQIAS